jgi:hypothetical protein
LYCTAIHPLGNDLQLGISLILFVDKLILPG